MVKVLGRWPRRSGQATPGQQPWADAHRRYDWPRQSAAIDAGAAALGGVGNGAHPEGNPGARVTARDDGNGAHPEGNPGARVTARGAKSQRNQRGTGSDPRPWLQHFGAQILHAQVSPGGRRRRVVTRPRTSVLKSCMRRCRLEGDGGVGITTCQDGGKSTTATACATVAVPWRARRDKSPRPKAEAEW